MKRLNKKGFTLVELLAVIVILAVVIGITIPTVLTVTENAKVKAYETALGTIQDYLQKQVDMSMLSPDLRDEGDTPYVAGVGTHGGNVTAADNTKIDASAAQIESKTPSAFVLEKTGYANNISLVGWTVSAGRVTITCAKLADKSEYNASSKIKECTA